MDTSTQSSPSSMIDLTGIKVVVFDCDGVMFDTTIANTAFYNSILQHCGRPEMTDVQVAFTMKHTVFESVSYLMDQDEELSEKALQYKKKMGYFPFLKKMVIEPGLKPLLWKLRHRYHTAIATNRTDTMPAVLKEFDLVDDFELVLTSLDVSRPKPAPDILLKVVEHFQCAPDQALYIGDSDFDGKAAAAAGTRFAAYRNKGMQADLHIEHLKEIETVLRLDKPQVTEGG